MKRQITIRLPEELRQQLNRKADERGYPIKDLIMFILWDWMTEHLKY